MTKKLKKISIFSIVLSLIVILVAGCNTMEGAGEDIEAAGQGIEDAAE